MKRCPTCQRVYTGEELNFCLDDGTQLLNAADASFDAGAATVRIPAPRLTNQSPTELYPAGDAGTAGHSPGFAQAAYAPHETTAPPAARKTNALPWILGAVILGLSAVVIGLLLMRRGEPEDSQVARNTTRSETTTAPFANATPSETISTQVAEANTSTTLPHHREATQTPSPATVVKDEPPPPPKPTASSAPRAPISGGMLNGKAVSLPKPAYPAIARAARASGTVNVQVTIDESGKVISARAVGGHPLLQQAAVQAAYGARFSPTLLSGQPVKVTGVITYNFVAQ
ncbi:MAG TPA: TonB family protein [Pyrinomonadaceae bacterium]|nr:TonB family protein [Pyrinomonadaceae bacterium]